MLYLVLLLAALLTIGILVLEYLAQTSPYNLRPLRRQNSPLADALPYRRVAPSNFVRLTRGRLLATFEADAPDMNGVTERAYVDFADEIERAWRSLGGRATVNIDTIAVPSRSSYPDGGNALDPVTRIMAAARRRHFERPGLLLDRRVVVSLTLSPSQFLQSAIESFERERTDESGIQLSQAITRALKIVEDLTDRLAPAGVTLRRHITYEVTDNLGRPRLIDESLSFLKYCLTGREQLVARPSVPGLARIFGAVDVSGSDSSHPIVDDQHIKIVSVEQFGDGSIPGSWDYLQDLAIPHLRHSTRLMFLDPAEAENVLRTAHAEAGDERTSLGIKILQRFGLGKNTPINRHADELQDEAESLLTAVKRGSKRLVHISSRFVVYDQTAHGAEQKAKAVRNRLHDQHFDARIERIAPWEEFVASMPGDSDHGVAVQHVDSLNAADLSPFSLPSRGPARHPHPEFRNEPPAALVRGYGSTAYRLYPWVEDLGHFLIWGPPGSGKSTFMLGMMSWMIEQYTDLFAVGFDRGGSSERYCLASGGDFHLLDPGDRRGFAPFAQIEDQTERVWVESWLWTLLEIAGVQQSPKRRGALWHALEVLAHSRTRSMSLLQTKLRALDPELAAALEFYTVAGPMGYLLDSERDNLSSAQLQIYELDRLFRLNDPRAIGPLALYLFHRVDQRIGIGQTKGLLTLDEPDEMFPHPIFGRKIGYYLDKGRKNWLSVGIATQRIEQFSKSPIAPAIVEGCKVRYALANPEANKSQKPFYVETLSVDDEGCDEIASLTAKKHVVEIKIAGNGGGSRTTFNTEFTPTEIAFLGASSGPEKELTARLRARAPRTWAADLLDQKARAALHEGRADAAAELERDAAALRLLLADQSGEDEHVRIAV